MAKMERLCKFAAFTGATMALLYEVLTERDPLISIEEASNRLINFANLGLSQRAMSGAAADGDTEVGLLNYYDGQVCKIKRMLHGQSCTLDPASTEDNYLSDIAQCTTSDPYKWDRQCQNHKLKLSASTITSTELVEMGYVDASGNAECPQDCKDMATANSDNSYNCPATASKCPLFIGEAFAFISGYDPATSYSPSPASGAKDQFWNSLMFIEDEEAYNVTCAARHPNFHSTGYNLTCVENELKADIKAVVWGIGMLRYDRVQYREISKMPDPDRKRNLIDLKILTSAIGVMPYDAMAQLAGPRPCITDGTGVLYNTCVGKGTHSFAGPAVEQVSDLTNPADLRSMMAQVDYVKLSRMSSLVADCAPTEPNTEGAQVCGSGTPPSFRDVPNVPSASQFRTMARARLSTEEGGVARILRRVGYDPVKAGVWADEETYARARPYAAHACVTRSVQSYSKAAVATPMHSDSAFSDIDYDACVESPRCGDPATGTGTTQFSVHRYNNSNRASANTD
jgi:hypothetical protein